MNDTVKDPALRATADDDRPAVSVPPVAADLGEPCDPASLAGQTVVVTGGGSGLGAAICRSLARSRMRVVVADVARERAESVAAELLATGGEALAHPIDVARADQAHELVREVIDRWGRFDVLVNNAGVDFTVPVEELREADWERVLRTNLHGPYLLSRAAIPVMKQQKRGAIVNIASTAAKRAWPNAAAYHASKWGLLGLSHALHAELRPHGIRVTAIVAGGMRTPFLLDRFPDIDPGVLQDPANVAAAVRFALLMPAESVIPEMMVLPCRETSWP